MSNLVDVANAIIRAILKTIDRFGATFPSCFCINELDSVLFSLQISKYVKTWKERQ